MEEEETDQIQITPTRRKIMKLASGTAASAFILPGIAAAEDDTTNKRYGQAQKTTSPEIRAEKAAREGKEWNEKWIDEDRMNETWVDTEPVTTTQGGRKVQAKIGVKGISIGVEAYFGNCNGWVEFTVFGQNARYTLTCSNACASPHYDAGAAYVDLETCVNWNTKSLRVYAKGCVWHVSGWSCASKEVVF